MPKGKRITEKERQRIIELRGQGMRPTAVAKKTGVSQSAVSQLYIAHQNGQKSIRDYQKGRMKERGFDTDGDYHAHILALHQERIDYRAVAFFIWDYLRDMEKDPGWLANEIGVSPSIMSRYMNAKSLPSDGTLGRITEVFGLPNFDLVSIIEMYDPS